MDGTGTAGLGLVTLVAAERYLPALSSLPLPRRPYTAPHHHETTGEYDTMRHFKRPRPHPHNVYDSVTLETFYFIVSYCREALTVPNLQVKLYPKYLCLGENSVRRVRYYPWFRAAPGGLGPYPPVELLSLLEKSQPKMHIQGHGGAQF